VTVYNRYWPPAHPTCGGEIETFKTFFARLVPDETERAWLWNWLAYKARRPWVPMVAVIMVAEEHGSGRGTLFNILECLFGKDYVAPCAFDVLTGRSAAARFNARLADALFVVVGEAVAEDGHQQAQRRLSYEALKVVIEPSPKARRSYEEKGQRVYVQQSAATIIIATNHRDVVKLPRADRRICVIICGPKMTTAHR
jgi:phage/plasmid-associated DNA primase